MDPARHDEAVESGARTTAPAFRSSAGGGMGPRVSATLAGGPPWLLTTYAATAAFTCYFCMYAFRKPFAAAAFEGQTFGEVTLKTALVISQVIGYTLSKYLGIRVLSEVTAERRPRLLLGLILGAWASLLAFALGPSEVKLAAMFGNGLCLGMVWGLVVGYLEGRRTSEILLAGLSCSFIVASGAVKDVGRFLMASLDVSENFMPFLTGALFLPLFATTVWMLRQLPAPTAEDRRERSPRQAMTSDMRGAFVRRFWLPMSLLLLAYLLLTAFRDFRDNYGVEVFADLGYGNTPALFTMTEVPVAVGVMVAMALLSLVERNARALLTVFGVMAVGVALLAGSTWLLDRDLISGAVWMSLLGLGSYLAYVPFGSVLFDRMFAHTRAAGTAVFAIYVADAVGYTGSVAVQLFKDLMQPSTSRLEFLREFTFVMAGVGAVLFALAAALLLRPRAIDVAVSPTAR